MSEQEIASPCVGVCSMDEVSGFCQGCFRTLEEIRQWWDLDNAAKAEVIKTAAAREAAVFGE
ncbi:DUF1289 domain-containing protein [Methylophilus glucosoxydans]|jgi:uncharacterized protein|uniref:DUF1289 domain-containing protein n=1 Tax=Methylophilus glucosoxydans TaxID=752553 RepID=A0ABW3GHV9_9PROT|nr:MULTISPECIES: DUF1289 domain-containing protein [unclassified Methylophilus]MBF5039546.1 DUF1289 domain-containing protein [Methylophilus sp. 13]MDT7849085.1 DUF1289 domain-containing protein [Methylophilus sp. VKM B-3414]BEV08970.1 DUF1289 domain-containing protein [Methylophilus sp. DW102]